MEENHYSDEEPEAPQAESATNEADVEPSAGADRDDAAEKQAGIKRERRRYVMTETKEWVKSIVIALVLALVLKAYVVQAYMIPTGSMEPTIMPRDRLFGNRFIYHFRDPKPGDIIAFIPPESVTGNVDILMRRARDARDRAFPHLRRGAGGERVVSYLKRVVAVGGDTVAVHGGRVYLNGVPLDEPYIREELNYEYPPVKVPEGKIFVLGDNRCNSHDSHVWGFLPRKNIQAKAFFRFWPPGRIGVVR